MKSINIKTSILYFAVFTVSILTTILNMFDNKMENGYQLLWLLPLSFTITSIFTMNIMKRIYQDVVIAIIWGGYFIRFVLTPLFLNIGNYRTFFSYIVSEYKIEKAIFLMTYEVIVVFFLLSIYLKVLYRKKVAMGNVNNYDSVTLNEKKYKTVHLVLLLLVIFCVGIYIYVPEIMNSYTWIFADKYKIAKIDYNIDDIAIRGTVKRALGSLFIFTFNIIRYLIPVYLLKFLSTRFKNLRLGYYISLFICMLPFLVINESNIQPFFGLLFNVIMMIKLYPQKRKKIVKSFAIIGGILVLSMLLTKLYLLAKWQGTSGAESISSTINAYFPGVGNAAAAYNIVNENKWKILFNDFFSTIPFRNSLFPSIAAEEITLTNLFNNYNGISGNIIPCISGSEYYMGTILAPILPAFLSCFALKMKAKAEASNDYWYYFCFLFFSIRVAIIPTLYNHIAFAYILINQFIPIYLATIFINQHKNRRLGYLMKQNISKLGVKNDC